MIRMRHGRFRAAEVNTSVASMTLALRELCLPTLFIPASRVFVPILKAALVSQRAVLGEDALVWGEHGPPPEEVCERVELLLVGRPKNPRVDGESVLRPLALFPACRMLFAECDLDMRRAWGAGLLRELVRRNFSCWWGCVSSSALGAPLVRNRVYLLAIRNGTTIPEPGRLFADLFTPLGGALCSSPPPPRLTPDSPLRRQQCDALAGAAVPHCVRYAYACLASRARHADRQPSGLPQPLDAPVRLLPASGGACSCCGRYASEPVVAPRPAKPLHLVFELYASQKVVTATHWACPTPGRHTATRRATDPSHLQTLPGQVRYERHSALPGVDREALQLELNPAFVEWLLGLPVGIASGIPSA